MTTNRQKPTLRCTKDYDLFEPHPYNRDVTKTKVLEQSMEQYGFDDGLPIRCVRNEENGKLRITHGHHRFHVARQKGLPVWFIVASNDIPLFDSEASSHAWDVRDFTVARARAGEQSAEAVLNYHEQTGIPLQACLSLVGGESAGSHNKMKDMKFGTFKVGSQLHANDVAKVVAHCKECGIQIAAKAKFVQALSKCLRVPEFDAEMFMHKAKVHSELMGARRTADEYIDLIELVYNRQQVEKIPLAFMARNAARQRSVTYVGKTY